MHMEDFLHTSSFLLHFSPPHLPPPSLTSPLPHFPPSPPPLPHLPPSLTSSPPSFPFLSILSPSLPLPIPFPPRSVIMGVRSLLMLLPTNHQIMEALEVFMYQPPEGASEDPHSPPSPQAVLEEFFGTNNTSPTQLLYNLEVQCVCGCGCVWCGCV